MEVHGFGLHIESPPVVVVHLKYNAWWTNPFWSTEKTRNNSSVQLWSKSFEPIFHWIITYLIFTCASHKCFTAQAGIILSPYRLLWLFIEVASKKKKHLAGEKGSGAVIGRGWRASRDNRSAHQHLTRLGLWAHRDSACVKWRNAECAHIRNFSVVPSAFVATRFSHGHGFLFCGKVSSQMVSLHGVYFSWGRLWEMEIVRIYYLALILCHLVNALPHTPWECK